MNEIYVNGESRQVAENTTLSSLVAELGIDAATVVADVSGDIVPRDAFDTRILKNGDTVELARIVGGG